MTNVSHGVAVATTPAAATHPMLYTRTGFAGPASIFVKRQYAPDHSYVQGDYVPRQLDLDALDPKAFADPRALPVPVLRDAVGVVSIEVGYRHVAMPFGVRNVFADEVHVVLAGSATLETEFGTLSLAKDDVVCIPRAVSYRVVDVKHELRELIYVSGPRLTLGMTVGFGPLDRLDLPQPWADPSVRAGDHEVILRHGTALTSVYYDYDPIPVMAVQGEAAVKKINMNDLGSIDISNSNGLKLPPKLYRRLRPKPLLRPECPKRPAPTHPLQRRLRRDDFVHGWRRWVGVDQPARGADLRPQGVPAPGRRGKRAGRVQGYFDGDISAPSANSGRRGDQPNDGDQPIWMASCRVAAHLTGTALRTNYSIRNQES